MKMTFSTKNAKPPGYALGNPVAPRLTGIDIESIGGQVPTIHEDITMQRAQEAEPSMVD